MKRKLLFLLTLLCLVVGNINAGGTFYAKVRTVVGAGKGTVYVKNGENQKMDGVTTTEASDSKYVTNGSETHVPFTIKATPSIGYEFSNISDGNESYTNSQITYQALTRSKERNSPDETTVTAYFTAKKYTVTFNANGGTIPDNGNMGNTPADKETSLSKDQTSGTVKVTYDSRDFRTMSRDIPVQKGYRFTGWFDGAVMVYDADGVGTGDYWNGEDGGWSHDSNVTLTAGWEQLAEVNMSVSAGKYGTFCAPFEVTIPSGIKAYTVQSLDGAHLNLSEVTTTTIPATTPVIVEGGDNGYDGNFYGPGPDAETCGTGILVGLLKDVEIPAGSYVLQTQSGKQAFYKVESAALGVVNRCYLKADAKAKVLNFNAEETAIEDLSDFMSGNVQSIYSANGAKVNSLQKGMNIVKMMNGQIKKIMVK